MLRNLTAKLFTLLLAIIVGSNLSLSSVYAQSGDWPEYKHDSQHTGYNDSSSVTPTLYERWHVDLGSSISDPVVANGVVYVTVTSTNPNTVKALNAETGATIWTYQGDADVYLGVPTVNDNTVYFVQTPQGGNWCSTGYVIALNAADGTVKWTKAIQSTFNTPAILNNTLYLTGGCNGQSVINALSMLDGSIVWTSTAPNGAFPATTYGSGVYVGLFRNSGPFDHNVFAFNASTGSTLWSHATGGSDNALNTAASNNVLFVQHSEGGIRALNTTTGSYIWGLNYVNQNTFAIAYSKLFVGGSANQVDARSTSNGSLLWSYSLPGTSAGNVNVAVANNYVFASGTTNGGLVVLDANNGTLQGSFDSPAGTYYSTPAITADAVYVSASNGDLYALDNAPPNEAPIVDPIANATINRGSTYTAPGSFTDEDSTSWTATVNYADGGGDEPLRLNPDKTFTLSHQYNTANEYTVTVTITDNQGASDTETATVTVIIPDPVTTTFNSAADTYVKSGSDNRNTGAGTFMRLQSSGDNRSLVQFDQTAMQNEIGNKEVLTAKLRVTIVDNANNWGTTGRTIDVHRLIANWSEGDGTENDRGTGSGATWNCAIDSLIDNQSKNCSGTTEWEMGQPNNPAVHPWVQTASDTETITNNQSGVVEFDVTSDVASFLNSTNQNYGWIIKKTAEGQNGQVSFGTKESASVPQLVVTYQP